MYQLGPAAGSSPGTTLARIVTVFGLSGLRNAYRSVRSADGSSAINGASRWLDAAPFPGPSVAAPTAAAAVSRPTAPSAMIPLRISCSSRFVVGNRHLFAASAEAVRA